VVARKQLGQFHLYLCKYFRSRLLEHCTERHRIEHELRSRVRAGTGTGGAGTYYVNPSQTASSTAITAGTIVETDWYCRTFGLPGELVKVSRSAQG